MQSDDEAQEEEAVRNTQPSTRPSHAFIAVFSILLVAFTNPSLTGLCYLCVFFTWGALCVTKLGSSACRASSLAVWGFVAAISTLVLVVQAAVQLLFFVGNDAWASDPETKEILELLGSPKALSGLDLFLDLFPPLFALVAASAEVNAARGAALGQQGAGIKLPRLRRSMAGLASLDSTGSQAYYALMWAAGYSNAGVLAAVALAVSALLWPAVLAWPYQLILGWQLWQWSLGREGSVVSYSACHVLQTYCGAHITALYLWQITILRASTFQRPAIWLGLYVISEDSPLYDVIPQVVQLAALHTLFAALGFYSGVKKQTLGEDDGEQQQQDEGTYVPASNGTSSQHLEAENASGPSGRLNVRRSGLSGIRPTTSLEEFFGEDVGLLDLTSNIELAKQLRDARIVRSPSDGAQYVGEGLNEDYSHAGHGGRPGIGTLLDILLPLAAGATVHAVGVLSSFPSIPAVALCLSSLVEPSCLSAGCLFIGLWVLLAPDTLGKHAFLALSRPLAALFVLWHLSAYVATSIGRTLALPALAQSIGVYVFASPPPLFLPLTAQLLTAVTLLGLARSNNFHAQQRRRSISREAEGASGTPREPLLGHTMSAAQRISSQQTGSMPAGSFGALLPRRVSRRSSFREDASGQSPRGRSYRPMAGVDLVGADTVLEVEEAGPPSIADSQETFDYEMDAGGAWAVLGLSTVHASFYCGLLLLPIGLFLVGVSEYNLLHAGYLVQLMLYFLKSAARLEPSITSAVISAAQHTFLRIYASLHLTLMSAAIVSTLPGMSDHLHKSLPEDWLQSLGLWNPSVSHSVAPVLVLLLAATIHSSLGNWLRLQSDKGVQLPGLHRGSAQAVQGAMGFPSVLLWSSRGFVSFGSLVIVLQAYILLLLRSDTSLLGLGYLALCIATFLNPPLRGEYEEKDEMGRVVDGPDSTVSQIYRGCWSLPGHHHFITMKGGKRSRWLPLCLLAVFAAIEFATQYLFIATNFAEVVGIPASALHFIEDVVGINTEHKGLSVRLLRSASLLGMLHLYRFGYVVGTLQAQHERNSLSSAEQERRKLQAQRGICALATRFFILHASKIVTFMLFWAAMQHPGGFGWILTVSLVLLSPLLGGPKATMNRRQALVHFSILATTLVTATWMLGQYATQVQWICDRAGPPDGLPARIVRYLGLLSCGSGQTLEMLLRAKCLILIAITLKRRSLRWVRHLPEAVKRAGAPSSQCCLFWTPSDAEVTEDSASLGLWKRIRNSALGRSVRLAIKDLMKQIQDSSQRLLQAMDWPATTGASGRHSPPEAEGSSTRSREPKQPLEAQESSEEASRSLLWRIVDVNRWLRQLHKVKLAFQDWAERFWQDWGMDLAMGTLLLAAFFSINLLSLVYLAMIAVGMAVPPHPRRLIWRFCVLPLLAFLLIAQYSFFIGLPPPFDRDASLGGYMGSSADGKASWFMRRHHDSDADSVKDWLGYGHIDSAALWALFFAFAATVLQVHHDLWHHSRLGRQYSWFSPSASQTIDASSPGMAGNQLGGRPNGASLQQANVWAPMEYEAMASWSWIDWIRFMFYRHYTDVVLVAVVALCTLENDVIHAAYLAIALLLFRRRDVLRTERQTLFRWLPLYNFAVMLLTLLYQSPFEDIWGHSLGPSLGCNLAHVLGLYKMSGASGGAFSLTYRGALADMILWAIFRLQTRVFASNTYDKVMRIVAREQAEELRSREARRLQQHSEQAAAVLEHSRLRKLRAMRLARLKAGLTEKGGLHGLDPSVLDMDHEQSAWVDAMKGLLGDMSQDKSTGKQQVDNSGRRRNLLRENAEQYSGRPLSGNGSARRGFDWRALLRIRWRRDDKESIICYFLFMALFVADFSALALVFPVVLYCYALLAQPPARPFWQVMLVFTESILIAQYVYQIPSRLHCSAATPRVRALAEEAGLHGNALRGVPIFCVYLATLMHTYSLARQKVPARELLQRRRSSIASPRSTYEAHPSGQPVEENADVEAGRQNRSASLALHARRSSIAPPAGGWVQGEPHLSDATGLVIRKWLLRLWHAVVGAVLHVLEFLRRICSSAERPLHFVKVQLGIPSGQKEFFETAAGQEVVVGTVQDILDMNRDHDIAAKFRQRELRRREATAEQAPPPPGAHLESDSGWFDAPRSRSSQHLADDIPGTSAGPSAAPRAQPQGSTWGPIEHIDLASIGPLKVVLNQMLEDSHPGSVSALLEVIPLRSTPANTWGLSSVEGSPIRSLKPAKHAGLTLLRHKAATQRQPLSVASSTGAAAALSASHQGQQLLPLDVGEEADSTTRGHPGEDAGSRLASFPLPDSPDQPFPGGSGSPYKEYPPTASRSQAPQDGASQDWAQSSGTEGAATEHGCGIRGVGSTEQQLARRLQAAAAQHDLSGRDRQCAEQRREGDAGGAPWGPPAGVTPGALTIEDVEWHGRIEQDWYAATALVDLLSFIYVAIFYQAVVTSARTLADITDERVVPVDYLGVLMLLFLLLVLDRLFYTLGLHLGKAVLFWTQMALFYWYTMVLFWSPATSTTAKLHLRILMAIKSLSFTFSALQLRNGYPPPASYRGGRGRHAFVFARHINNFGTMAFHVFQAIPFLFELRELLDWSCTATTLTLFDWLKLEDISISLFFVTVSRQNRQRHRLGERQPRYIKFFQGTLLFLGLLLLLWVPLLVFSSGNPTYQVPEVLSFSFNATLGTARGSAGGQRGPAESVSFPLFSAGERRSQAPWAGNGSLPPSMQEAYSPNQIQLLCTAEDSDRFWRVTPPARRSLERMLGESEAELALGWAIVRSAPLESKHGGPLCQGTRQVALSGGTREALLEVLQGTRTRAALRPTVFPNGTAVANATRPGALGSRGLYGLFWQLRGGECSVRTDFGLQDMSAGTALGESLACDLGIEGGDITKGEEVWWRLNCTVIDAHELPVNSTGTGRSTCVDTLADGPRVVAVLERVQGGIIGQTLSSFGITGLYITFVFGIGRFLRFSTQNARMRIQYEDLPTTQRLVALCQDIYIARAEGELELEEELYWALVNIYRSPAVMFELTKRKVA
ncbi:g4456 [Coccomyxa elongata]